MKRILLPFIIILLMSGNTAWAGGLFPGTAGVSDAKDVKFDNTEASLTGDPDDVQTAIEAVKTEIGNISAGTLADIDDLPGDSVDDNLIDAALLADLSSIYSTTDHTHTGSTISGIDISDDTNLSGDTEIVLTGDALSIASTIARDSELPTATSLHVDDIITLSGVAQGAQNLGSFTGSTIADNQTIKAALQALETAVEGVEAGGLADIDDLPGDSVDDDKIDASLIADLSSTYSTTGHTHSLDADFLRIVGGEITIAASLDFSGLTSFILPNNTSTARDPASSDFSTFHELTENGDNEVILKARDSIASDITIYLPDALPSVDGCIVTVSSLGILSDSDGYFRIDTDVERVEILKYAYFASSMGLGGNAQIDSADLGGSDGELSFKALVDGTMTEFFRLCGACDLIHFTKPLETPASTATLAGLKIPSGTAPSSPAEGDIYYDGTHLYFKPAGAAVDLLVGTGSGLASTDIDTSAELRGILTDELGTGALLFDGAGGITLDATLDAAGDFGFSGNVFGFMANPSALENMFFTSTDNLWTFSSTSGATFAFTQSVALNDGATATSISFGADPGDSGALRLSNNTAISWETSTPGTDIFIALDSSDILQVGQNCADIRLGTSGTGNVTVTGDLTVIGSDISVGAAGVKITGDGDGAITLLGLGDGSNEDLTINLDDTANTVKLSSSTDVTDMDFSAINLVTTGTITGRVPMITIDSARSLTAAECHGGFVMITAAGTYPLPAAATAGYGSTVCIYVRDASETVVIEVDGSDKINLNGTALDAGDTIDSAGNAGDFICLISTTDADGSGTDGWRTLGKSGTWTDGGAN